MEEWIRDYLVERVLSFFKAPKRVVVIVNTLITLDALTIVKIILQNFGLSKFINILFWVGLFV